MSHSHRSKWMRRLSQQQLQAEVWKRSHILKFYKVDDGFLSKAPTFFTDQDFHAIRKHPRVRQFMLDFYVWNEKVLWLVTSTSQPYIEMQRKLAHMVNPFVGKSLVDLGCGSGDFCAQLFQSNGASVKKIFAIDIDWKVLTKVPDVLSAAGYRQEVALIQGSTMSKLPIWDSSVDCVVSSLGGLMYAGWWFDDKQMAWEGQAALLECLGDIRRILRPGGYLAFSAPRPNPDWGAVLKGSIRWLIKHGQLVKLYRAIRYGVPAKHLSQFMNQVESEGHAHYLSVEEWSKLLDQAGFEVIESSFGEVYAKQGVVVLARKK